MSFLKRCKIEAMDISIILPTLDNFQSLQETITFIKQTIAKYNKNTEIIVVDDGSQLKNEIENVCQLQNVKYIRLEKNHGKGFAIKTGFSEAKGKILVFCDSDFPFQEDSLQEFFHSCEHMRCDVLTGDRRKFKENFYKSGFLRRHLSKTFNFICKLILDTGDFDNQCGLKAFKRESALVLFKSLLTNRYSFDAEIIYKSNLLGLEIQSIPIYLKIQKSTNITLLTDGFHMLFDLVRIRIYSKASLKI